MRRVVLVGVMAAALASGSACAARAAAPAASEPLQVPPVPPRVIVPDIEEVVMTPPDAGETRAPAPKPEASKPPEKPAEPPKPGSMESSRAEEAPRVRTPQTANDELAEREVRAIMARAQATLRGVSYTGLSSAARQQYDTAQRFIRQADNALRIRNYVFARNLADKAETLARQLGKGV